MTSERLAIPDGIRLHPERSHFLTASEIPAIAGEDPFKTALRLWNEKQGLVPPEKENAAMKRGRWLEAAAVEGLKEEHPDWLITRPRIFVIDRDLRLGATPDALITRPDHTGTANCQIKCTTPLGFDRYWAGGVPIGYKLQTATEGLLLGSVTNFVACLVVDSHSATIALYELPRSPTAEAEIIKMAADFWRRIAEGQPYPPDFARDAQTVRAMYPKAEPQTVIDLTGDNRLAELLPVRTTVKAEIADLEKQVTAIDTEIIAKIGTNEVAEVNGYRLTYRNEPKKGYTVPDRNPRVLRVKKED